jgi:hypothetical protein
MVVWWDYINKWKWFYFDCWHDCCNWKSSYQVVWNATNHWYLLSLSNIWLMMISQSWKILLHMTLLFIYKTSQHLWLSRNHILCLLFNKNKFLFHIDILTREIGGICIGVDILGNIAMFFTNLCSIGIKGIILDQFQPLRSILVGLISGGIIWTYVWGVYT